MVHMVHMAILVEDLECWRLWNTREQEAHNIQVGEQGLQPNDGSDYQAYVIDV